MNTVGLNNVINIIILQLKKPRPVLFPQLHRQNSLTNHHFHLVCFYTSNGKHCILYSCSHQWCAQLTLEMEQEDRGQH